MLPPTAVPRPALLPGLLTLALLASVSCSDDIPAPSVNSAPCEGDVVAIPDIQGPGDRSPLEDSLVVTRGVVTLVQPNSGLYIETTVPGDANRSRGLFVSSDAWSRTLLIGQLIEVTGRVAELGEGPDTLTALIEGHALSVCSEDSELPITTAELPLTPRAREGLEGMRLSIRQPLVISDVYAMHRGEWTVSAGEPPRMPTEDGDPGPGASEQERLIRDRELMVNLPGPDFPAAPAGAAVGAIRGVLGHDGQRQRLFAETRPTANAYRPQPIQPRADDRLRIVSANLLNYFNGDGRGGGFPTERGAESPGEFAAQQERTGAALAQLRAHLLAVQELENDGFGPDSAARSLLELLGRSGDPDWAAIDPGTERIGGDVITVGLFYRQERLEAVGPPHLLEAPAFDGLSRQPLAQLFRDRASGETLLIAVNHLKSKGRCPDDGPDSDQGDGQGCWNRARTEAVEQLGPWLEKLAQEAGTQNVLVLGDMNAWRREDPIRAFRTAGYVELVESLAGVPQHSFLYYGKRGTLDYAFATPGLARSARQAAIWHINADWPQRMALPQPWLRMSDHDPVVVDFDFSQAATSD